MLSDLLRRGHGHRLLLSLELPTEAKGRRPALQVRAELVRDTFGVTDQALVEVLVRCDRGIAGGRLAFALGRPQR